MWDCSTHITSRYRQCANTRGNAHAGYSQNRRYYATILVFDVLLTVHLSIFILLINQLDAQNLFYNKFISCLYMFRAPCADRQEVRIVLYSLWYHHTCRWPFHAQVESVHGAATYKCDDTRGCIIQF